MKYIQNGILSGKSYDAICIGGIWNIYRMEFWGVTSNPGHTIEFTMKYIQNGILSCPCVYTFTHIFYEIYTEWNFEEIFEKGRINWNQWNIYRMEFWVIRNR